MMNRLGTKVISTVVEALNANSLDSEEKVRDISVMGT